MNKELVKNQVEEDSLLPVDLEIASFVLRSGGTLLYPTETVWGLGCDATDEDAVQQLKELKHINDNKAFIILVDSIDMLREYVGFFPEVAMQILKDATRPTTLIYPKAKGLAKNVIAEDGSIAIRITTNTFCLALMKKTKAPLVSTSANMSGKDTPKEFGEIDIDLIYNADYVVRWGQDMEFENTPSSIVKILENGETIKIR